LAAIPGCRVLEGPGSLNRRVLGNKKSRTRVRNKDQTDTGDAAGFPFAEILLNL
jgi:hypothetical protein